ncbi:MAG: nucleotidyltransferase domain-containing protein [Anaerolineales bacterium]
MANKFKEAYLFGSYARGDNDPDSDVDVLIVLADFEKVIRRGIEPHQRNDR